MESNFRRYGKNIEIVDVCEESTSFMRPVLICRNLLIFFHKEDSLPTKYAQTMTLQEKLPDLY